MNRGRWIVGVALVAAAACAPAGPPQAAPADTASPPTADAAPSSTAERRGGTQLERSRSDASSDIERRIADTFSELGATSRGGDTVITLPDTVLFEFDRHDLRPDATRVLDDLTEAITYFADAPVRVTGHTDGEGTAGYNLNLSQRRADAVVDHLVAGGVERDRITARGVGETQPVAAEVRPDGSDDPAARARNRRVEIVIEGVDPADLNG